MTENELIEVAGQDADRRVAAVAELEWGQPTCVDRPTQVSNGRPVPPAGLGERIGQQVTMGRRAAIGGGPRHSDDSLGPSSPPRRTACAQEEREPSRCVVRTYGPSLTPNYA